MCVCVCMYLCKRMCGLAYVYFCLCFTYTEHFSAVSYTTFANWCGFGSFHMLTGVHLGGGGGGGGGSPPPPPP